MLFTAALNELLYNIYICTWNALLELGNLTPNRKIGMIVPQGCTEVIPVVSASHKYLNGTHETFPESRTQC